MMTTNAIRKISHGPNLIPRKHQRQMSLKDFKELSCVRAVKSVPLVSNNLKGIPVDHERFLAFFNWNYGLEWAESHRFNRLH